MLELARVRNYNCSRDLCIVVFSDRRYGVGRAASVFSSVAAFLRFNDLRLRLVGVVCGFYDGLGGGRFTAFQNRLFVKPNGLADHERSEDDGENKGWKKGQ